jgi:hypothetical protein
MMKIMVAGMRKKRMTRRQNRDGDDCGIGDRGFPIL